MNNIQTFGKFLDQPMLIAKFQKSIPTVLAATTIGYTAYNVHNAKEEEKKNTALKTGITLGFTALSAVFAPKIASKITKREMPKSVKEVQDFSKNTIENFIKTSIVKEDTKNILEKTKNKILSFNEVKTLFEKFSDNKKGKEFLEKLMPSPKNVSAKDIFSEIGYLSVYGAVPVAGGIAGGISADIITDKDNWKNKISNKIKEGAYQYLANIFLCNIGAGAALAGLESASIHSKAARAVGMTAGIIFTGIIGGSKIANMIGRKIIDPICGKLNKNINNKTENKKERTPEIIDIGLHTDDIATVSLLSGLKWIEPALPLMYSVSGYRAGIGYRN